MKYISEDGKVFNTEQEYCKYERQIEEQRAKRKQLEKERQNRLTLLTRNMKNCRICYLNMREIMELGKDHMLHRSMKF